MQTPNAIPRRVSQLKMRARPQIPLQRRRTWLERIQVRILALPLQVRREFVRAHAHDQTFRLMRRLQVMALLYEVIPYGRTLPLGTVLFKLTIPWPQWHAGCLRQYLDHLHFSKRCRQPDHTELILFLRAIILKGPQQAEHHQ